MRLKAGVSPAGLTPQLLLGLLIAEGVYRRAGWDLRVTSLADGEHAGRPVRGDDQDPHYVGKAADLGIKEIPEAQWPGLVDSLKLALGAEFVVLLEKNHIHCQWGHIA